MPNRTKYPREKKDEVYKLYHQGTDGMGHNRSGDKKLTLKQIEKITGVPAYYVCAIGKGYR